MTATKGLTSNVICVDVVAYSGGPDTAKEMVRDEAVSVFVEIAVESEDVPALKTWEEAPNVRPLAATVTETAPDGVAGIVIDNGKALALPT